MLRNLRDVVAIHQRRQLHRHYHACCCSSRTRSRIIPSSSLSPLLQSLHNSSSQQQQQQIILPQPQSQPQSQSQWRSQFPSNCQSRSFSSTSARPSESHISSSRDDSTRGERRRRRTRSSSERKPARPQVYRSLERQDGTVPLIPREEKGIKMFPLRTEKNALDEEKREAKRKRRMMKREHAILRELERRGQVEEEGQQRKMEEKEEEEEEEEEEEGKGEGEEEEEEAKEEISEAEQRKRIAEAKKRAAWLELLEEGELRRKEKERYKRLKKKAAQREREDEDGVYDDEGVNGEHDNNNDNSNRETKVDYSEIIQAEMEPAITNLTRLAELHPRQTILPDDKWMAMRAMLIDGFTIGQLGEYIKRAGIDSKPGTATTTITDEKGEWQAALTSLLDKRGSSKRSKFTSSAAIKAQYTNLRRYLQGKSGLAERILRVAWGLGRPGDLGRLEFALDDLKMYVLLHHQHQHQHHQQQRGAGFAGENVTSASSSSSSSSAGFLKRVSDLYDAKIDVQGKKNIIRITGTKAACNSCHDAIIEYIEEIRQYDFSPRRDLRLSKYIDKKDAATIEKVEDEFLDMLESEYHVIIDTKGKGGKTVCSIISPDENTFNDASRMVELAMHLQSKPTLSSTASFSTFVGRNEQIPLSRSHDLGKLNWLERHAAGEYLRWVSPIAQEAIPGGRSARRPPMSVIGEESGGPMADVKREIFKTVKGKPTKKILTSPHVREVVDAQVGNVLFFKMNEVEQTTTDDQVEGEAASEEAPQEAAVEVKEEENGSKDVTFDQLMEKHQQSASFHQSAIPAVDDIMRVSQPITFDHNRKVHRVQLHPSSKNPEAPIIEVELSRPSQQGASSSEDVRIHRAVAILHPQKQHMLLPWTNTDLQFTRSWHYDMFEGTLPNEKGEESNPISSIREVFSNLQFNHRSSPDSSSLPATANITLPSGLTPPSSSTSLEYEYILPSTNHIISSQLHRFKYRDHELNYQAISDGGVLPTVNRSVMLTMNRYEDSLIAQTPADENKETADREELSQQSPANNFQHFYAAAARLAFEVGAIAMEQGKRRDHAEEVVPEIGDEDVDELDEYIARNVRS